MANLSGCTIAFDLDGTLVDTVGDIHRALNHVLAQEGLPPADLADVRNFVGLGARVLLVRAFGAHGVSHDDATLDRLTDLYVEANAADIAALSRPFPGVIDALENLKSQGATLSVCTNKRGHLSVQLLTALNMHHHFAAIAGGDDVPERKPHPGHYIHAVRAAGGDPARSIMVGDSINDVLSAKGAGAPVALYAFGYTDTAPELLGADAVFTHFTDLPDLLVRLLES
ncbi:MAG: HAD family hydrolase [Hyphomonadaceae bacterium]